MRLEEILRDFPLQREVFEPKKGDKRTFEAEVSRDPSGKIVYIKPGFGDVLRKG